MKFECKICGLTFESAHAMRTHFRTYAHREKADMDVVDVMLNKFVTLAEKQEVPTRTSWVTKLKRMLLKKFW